MKVYILAIVLLVLSVNYSKAQVQISTSIQDTVVIKKAPEEIKKDSLKNETPNAVIKSNVNKDGIIEISKKEFDKIPPARQEMIRKDAHYKIIED